MGAPAIVWAVLIIAAFLVGLRLMQSPRTALWGNRLCALCMALALFVTIVELKLAAPAAALLYMAAGAAVGFVLAQKVKMIGMPQTVALLNGLGGAASALVAGVAAAGFAFAQGGQALFFWSTAGFALATGTLTLSGSAVAALKLQGYLRGRPTVIAGHALIMRLLLLGGIALILFNTYTGGIHLAPLLPALIVIFTLFGLLMALRIGGADMPVIISFLNSLSGVAAAVCGLAVENLILVGTGALVGVAGLILTRIMCRAMNRSLPAVLGGFSPPGAPRGAGGSPEQPAEEPGEGTAEEALSPEDRLPAMLREAQKIIVVPGYGMAVAQAQQAVKDLIDACEARGKEVKIAIHPVAGRMPGHMTVLLAETGIDYDKLFEMDAINPEFPAADLVIVVGACDVVNPAAGTAEGTPIYGMPVLHAEQARGVLVCNLDEKPGYSGVENFLYGQRHVVTVWGDAAETVPRITAMLD